MTSMTIEKGGQYYHWYFGPVRVIEINDDQVIVYIKYPDGIYKESDKTKKTGNFSCRDFDKWFFSEPSSIINSLYFKEYKQHRFYYPEHQINYLELEVVEIKKKIAKNNEIISRFDNWIIDIQMEISSTEELISNKSMEKMLTIEELEGYQGSLIALSAYIKNVENCSINSPRELKSGLEKLSVFYEEKQELLISIILTEESIELKVSEIDNLSRKIVSLINKISEIEKEKEEKQKIIKILSNKIDIINKDIEKMLTFIRTAEIKN